MFKKIVLAAVAASTGVFFFAACGGDDCQTAADNITAKLKSCNITATTSTSSSSSGSSECTADEGKAATALANCVTAATCDALTGKDTAGAATYAKCIVDASSAGGSTATGAGATSSGTGG